MQNVPQVAVKPYPKFFTIFTTIVLFLLVVFIAQFLINKTNQSYLTPVNSEVEESGGLIGKKNAMVAPGRPRLHPRTTPDGTRLARRPRAWLT